MSEISGGEELLIKEGARLPENGSFKYVHVPEGTHFGVEHPETLVLGKVGDEHRDIAANYFRSVGAAITAEDAQKIGYVNAGLLKINDKGHFLMGKSGGLSADTGTHKKADMTRLTDEEKEALDIKTIKYLKNIYPDINFKAI